jgi:hypothetical protein
VVLDLKFVCEQAGMNVTNFQSTTLADRYVTRLC